MMKRKWYIFTKPAPVTLEEFLNDLELTGHNIFQILSYGVNKVITWKMVEVISIPFKEYVDEVMPILESDSTNKFTDDKNYKFTTYTTNECVFDPGKDKVKEGFIHRG